MLKVSLTQGGRSYSNWICHLSSDDYPCDEYGLFLLSYTFKRHVIVILMDQLWCTFVSSNMTTFEKLCKSDHILVWLGDDKYAEVKPLHIKGSNIAEWQQLADSIDTLHEKNKSNKKPQRRAEKMTASVSTPKKRKLYSPVKTNTRITSRRDSKVSIDYKRFHEMGSFESKKRKTEKFLPRGSGPSESRLEAQKQITKTNENSRKVVTEGTYQPRCTVAVSNIRPTNIKQEYVSSYRPSKPVKPEPGIYVTRRRNPIDLNRNWKYVHVSGRPCRQGGERDCNSQSENELEDDANRTLPDLHPVSDISLSTVYLGSRNGNKGNDMECPPNLISPPAVLRHTEPPARKSTPKPTNLGDLLCTLNFDVIPNEDKIHRNAPVAIRRVVTPTPHTDISPENTPGLDDKVPSSAAPSRTSEITLVTVNPNTSDGMMVPITISDETSSSPIDSPSTTSFKTTTSRKVVTPTPSTPSTPNANVNSPTKTPARTTTLDHGDSNHETDGTHNIVRDDLQTPKSSSLTNSLSSPRSVVTDPDIAEIETANALLELGNTPNTPNAFDAMYDNSELLPIDKEPLEDITKSLREEIENANKVTVDINTQPHADGDVNNNTDDHSDSDKTVDYTYENTTTKTTNTDEMSPKGEIRYKHYGTVRQGPSKSKSRTMTCFYCEEVFDSKKAINDHHKAEHTKVRCPDCTKVFPTPDALQRHRYIHDKSRHYKCVTCNKLCAFKSDLEMHMTTHKDDRLWYCSYDDCGRDFKRKSDLTAHEVVHTGETFMCEFSTCTYTNKDPHLVKRHQRVHTRVAKVKCPECAEKFIFYQQMKRHRNTFH